MARPFRQDPDTKCEKGQPPVHVMTPMQDNSFRYYFFAGEQTTQIIIR
jgi:hypothetical protein